MGTNQGDPGGEVATFTRLKRRDQFVGCAIDAIAELGFPRASVAEVARRAGVSKGVVTYHFPAKADLISAIIADVLASMREYIEPYMLAANPELLPQKLIKSYITAYASFYRTHAREVLALVRIYNAFRDESGRPNPAFDARAEEVTRVGQALGRGQALGAFRTFDPEVMAAAMKAALDDLLTQFADHPQLDLEAYSAELVVLFERATRPGSDSPSKPETGSEPAPDLNQIDRVTLKEEQ